LMRAADLPPPEDLRLEFFRSSGPGGQNVNKVSTAVRLRFALGRSGWLTEEEKTRLRRLAGKRMSAEDELVIEARRFRTQEGNRRDAEERLARLIAAARRPPRTRRATRPSAAERRRRLEAKRKRSQKKRLRSKPTDQD
jgi:ribosome-associated protein